MRNFIGNSLLNWEDTELGRAQKASERGSPRRKERQMVLGGSPFQGWEAHGKVLALTQRGARSPSTLSPTCLYQLKKAATWWPWGLNRNLHCATFVDKQSRPGGPNSRVTFHRRDRTSEIRPWVCWQHHQILNPTVSLSRMWKHDPLNWPESTPRTWGWRSSG